MDGMMIHTLAIQRIYGILAEYNSGKREFD
jgi:hypothetical protein